MIGYAFSQIYATILDMYFSNYLEKGNLWTHEWVIFMWGYQTIDHIFTLQAIIQEVLYYSSTIFCYFIEFKKAFE